MRKLFAGAALAASILRIVPVSAAEPPPFPDMSTSWYLYREAVAVLRDRGVIDGYPDGTFKPQATVNRAEFLKLVFAAKESDGGAADDCFSDVPRDAWFAGYVCAAKRRGIVTGYPDGTFKPEQEVNWAEAIALLARAEGWDVGERAGERWYEPFVETYDRRDVLPAHSYVPWHALSRERAADLVYRMLQFERGVTFEKSPGCAGGDGVVPTGVEVNGVRRSWIANAPSSSKNGTPAPLIVAFHGRTNSNAQVKNYMRFERDATDAIVVYPAGMPAAGGGYTWAGEGGADVAFFDAIVEEIGAHLCVDMDRIYVAGHSLGAWMANSVACLRGGVVRASASLGGDGITNNCTGPTAAFVSHNPHDQSASFDGSVRVREARVEENACSWDTSTASPRSLLCVKHAGCQGGNDVLWCPHEIDTDERGQYYPHTWPRGTGKYMVDFFRSLEP